VKASGGIRTLDTVLSARAAGAARCGVSATKVIMEEALLRENEGRLVLPEILEDMQGGY
jgi:deoxyribose-phosphate aldolase